MNLDCDCFTCREGRRPRASEEDLTLAVKFGAGWLDQHDPEWVEKIHLESLKMDDTGQCILGQCLGDYWNAQEYIEAADWEPWVYENGFDVPNINDYGRIRDIWSKYIKERREVT